MSIATAPLPAAEPMQGERLTLLYSSLAHALMHLMTAFYSVIVVSLALSWNIADHQLLELYAPATVLFVMARREQGRRLFSPRELAVLAVSVAGAVAGVLALALGWISL